MSFGLDLLRHLFCLAVIVQHMASASRYSVQTSQVLATVVTWVDGAVLGFFFISGFLYKQPASVPAYAKRQVLRLLVPYFVFSLLYAVALAMAGKADLSRSLAATFTLHGAGMQLYFLPGLLLVGVLHAALGARLRGAAGLLALGAFGLSVLLPTPIPTGPDLRLLPLYACAFSLGVLIQQLERRGRRAAGLTGLLLVSTGIGLLDPRYHDLALVLALFLAVLLLWPVLPPHRLAGSGGVYLLHTPVVNFALSTALAQLGLQQGWNIAVTVVLTYALCLALTLFVVRRFPAHRWLLLE